MWQLAKKVPVPRDAVSAGGDDLMVETKKFRAKEKCVRCQPVGTEDISTACVDVPEKNLLAYDPSHSLDLNDVATMVRSVLILTENHSPTSLTLTHPLVITRTICTKPPFLIY